ncbi:alcohol dehydrogenase, partial [bacterium]
PSPHRRTLATQLGADLVVDPRSENLADAVFAAAGAPAPVVFECVGIEGTLEDAMELVARGGRVIVAGVCMKEDRIRPLVGINKQLTIQFVLGYTPQEFADSLAALGDGSIDTAPMVTREVSLDELPAAFAALADPRDCKVVLRF